MVRGPRARAVPKNKVMPEDGETLKAAMKAEANGKLRNGGGSHQLTGVHICLKSINLTIAQNSFQKSKLAPKIPDQGFEQSKISVRWRC